MKKSWFKKAVVLSQIDDEVPHPCSQPETKPMSIDRRIKRFHSQNEILPDSKRFAPDRLICSDFYSANWIDNFSPKTINDLAVHPKKIEEIQDWIIRVNQNTNKGKILLVNGASGVGKTVVIKLIGKKYGFNIIEWITPVDIDLARYEKNYHDYNDKITYREGQAERFQEFLFKGSRYTSVFDCCEKNLLLVEDFPNIFIKSPEKFNEILSRYVEYGKSPLIFIATDTRSKQLNIVFNLFSDSVRAQYAIDQITFNPVSSTLLKKGLKRICGLMSQPGYSQYYRQPGQDVIESVILSAQGDIRSAVLNLHFASQKNSPKLNLEIAQASSSKSTKSKTSKQTKLKSIGRDETITLMHALGRVFNPKLVMIGEESTTPLNRFTHSPEEITDSFQSQPSNFIAFVHTNYLMHYSAIENVSEAASILCQSDRFMKEYRDDALSNFALNVAIRGVMVENVKPLSGWKPVRGPKRLTEYVFYFFIFGDGMVMISYYFGCNIGFTDKKP